MSDLALMGCRFPDLIMLRSASLQSLFLNGSHLGHGLGADQMKATGGVFMRHVVAKRSMRLAGAKLGGDLSCVGAVFDGGGGAALLADRLEAKGGVFLREVATKGPVRLLGARIGGTLECDGAAFDGGGVRAFSADGCRVEGGLFWRGGVKAKGVVDMNGASFGSIADEVASWPAKGDLILNRCQYGAFINAPVDAKVRLDWLSRQAPERFGEDFWPQPYEECARVLREMGHAADARAVLIEKERLQRVARRARIGRDTPFWPVGLLWFWDGLLGVTVRYGRQPLLAFAWLAGFWLLGAGVFFGAESFGAVKPNLPQVQRAPEWVLCGVEKTKEVDLASLSGKRNGLKALGQSQYSCYLAQPEALSYPQFNALVYSADVLLPVVSLEMQSYWLPNDEVPVGAAARLYLWFQIAVGWALTLLAVAGFSGLIKQDSK